MGAETFYNRVHQEESPREAFKIARSEGADGGYSGTIAEKHGYTMSRKPKEIDAVAWVKMVQEFGEDNKEQEYYFELKKDFSIYDDKWGDALCVPTDDGFIFCGWASS